MVKSMTGYGKAETEINGKRISAEIRSLNSKQLDLGLRMPQIYRPYEHEIRSRIAKTVQRGKVDFYISAASDATAQAAINTDLFDAYFAQLNHLCVRNGMKLQGGSDVAQAMAFSTILRMPDVVSSDCSEIPEEEQEALMRAVDLAIGGLEAFRAQEGRELMADLLARVDRIRALKESVEPYEKPRVELYRNRIRENIASMNIPVDSNRLEQEMIFYIEKLDITEEKVRLENHCKYFREVAAGEESAGRKLGFIAQEMGREINTLGSKANDADIQKIVVEMKDELEKIKEQILNIL